MYLAFYRMRRREQYVQEKDFHAGVMHYSEWDTGETVAEEMFPDPALNVEEEIIAKVMSEKLHDCLALLPESDRELLHALYFEGQSERQLCKKLGVGQKTVNDRKRKALGKLRNMFGVK